MLIIISEQALQKPDIKEWNEAHPLQRKVQSGMVLHNNSATRDKRHKE